jgi:hypothetical protein
MHFLSTITSTTILALLFCLTLTTAESRSAHRATHLISPCPATCTPHETLLCSTIARAAAFNAPETVVAPRVLDPLDTKAGADDAVLAESCTTLTGVRGGTTATIYSGPLWLPTGTGRASNE